MILDIENGIVELAFGSGGRASAALIEQVFVRHFKAVGLNELNDFASISVIGERVIFASDSHVISPLFFQGGDIGSLAVNGTVNDVAMSGGRVHALSVNVIIEEGLSLRDLDRVAESMAIAAMKAGINIVTGDTKVVERGAVDGLYISTSGIGSVNTSVDLKPSNIQYGDKILVNGSIGDHGASIFATRNQLQTELRSDCCALNKMIEGLMSLGLGIRCMRDPTRGGLASALNEIATQSQKRFLLNQASIPIKPEVNAIAGISGIDALNLANEGKVLVFCDSNDADAALDYMKSKEEGKNAQIIGEVCAQSETSFAGVEISNVFGGRRILEWPWSDPLPRIC